MYSLVQHSISGSLLRYYIRLGSTISVFESVYEIKTVQLRIALVTHKDEIQSKRLCIFISFIVLLVINLIIDKLISQHTSKHVIERYHVYLSNRKV